MTTLDERLLVVDAALCHWPQDEESSPMLHLAAQIGRSHRFSKFIQPDGPISGQAFEATGLEWRSGRLRRHGERVVALPERLVMEKFVKFVAKHGQPGMVLVTHNVKVLRSVVDAVRRQRLCVHFHHLVRAGHTSAADIRNRLNLGPYGEDGGDATLKGLAKWLGYDSDYWEDSDEPVTTLRLNVMCAAIERLGITSRNLRSPKGNSFVALHESRTSSDARCKCRLHLLLG